MGWRSQLIGKSISIPISKAGHSIQWYPVAELPIRQHLGFEFSQHLVVGTLTRHCVFVKKAWCETLILQWLHAVITSLFGIRLKAISSRFIKQYVSINGKPHFRGKLSEITKAFQRNSAGIMQRNIFSQ